MFQVQNRGLAATAVVGVRAYRGNSASPSTDLIASDMGIGPLVFSNDGTESTMCS